MGRTDASNLQTYDALSKLFHWLMALLIIGLIALGMYVEQLPFSPEKLKLISWHKWGGICALILVVIRLLWRGTRKPLPAIETIAPWQQLGASVTHVLLYLLMIAIPLSGWVMSSAKGVPTVLFGLWKLPDLVSRNLPLGDILMQVHWALNLLLIAILVLHIAAAVKHHYIDKDPVLRRMLPKTR